MERKKSTIPFVGLHAHSVVGSPFDGFGYPQEHMDYAWNNGMSALALTDHGNMNGMSYQVLHAKGMKVAGKEFKPIFGVEAYFVPSVDKWKEAYDQAKESGLPTEDQKRKDFIDSGEWSQEEEDRHEYLKKTIDNQERQLAQIFLESQRKDLREN